MHMGRKQKLVFICLVIMPIILAGCKNETAPKPIDEMRMREIGWNSLDEKVKNTVIHEWKLAEVTSAKWDDIDVKVTEDQPKRVCQVFCVNSFKRFNACRG